MKQKTQIFLVVESLTLSSKIPVTKFHFQINYLSLLSAHLFYRKFCFFQNALNDSNIVKIRYLNLFMTEAVII